MLTVLLSATSLLGAGPSNGNAVARPIDIFPKPSSVVRLPGAFAVPHELAIVSPTECRPEAAFLANLVEHAGVHCSFLQRSPARGANAVQLRLDPAATGLGNEGYTLSISLRGITVRAHRSAGIFYGIQSLRQMLPPSIEHPSENPYRLTLPCVEIVDRPRFGWRGMMLDVSRHFFDKPAIEHFLDLLAMHKMNVLHWHLTDDGGWRIEIKKYPKLTDVGAWRRPSKAVWDYQHLAFPAKSDGAQLYGGFYTQDEVREIVQYAAKLHITIVPEIEMPGHSLAAIESYPELACSGASVEDYAKESGMPYPNVICAGKEETFKFLEAVIDEVVDLFPSKYIHIGGDEVDKFLWRNCSDCQHRMREERLSNPEELQSYFVRRIERYINSKGRKMIGWDEILEGGLAPNAAVMSWRGITGGVAAAKSGHDVVMSPTSHCYFDYSYATTPTEHVLGFEPTAGIESSAVDHVLGGQCNLWTEYVPDLETAEQRLFPRIVSMSEALWSESRPPLGEFMDRLGAYYDRLQALGVQFYVSAPKAEFNVVVLDAAREVAFKAPTIPDATVRYTTDGTEPTASSTVYKEPIKVDRPLKVAAATFLSDGRKGDSTTVEVVSPAAPPKNPLEQGLCWKMCLGAFKSAEQISGPWTAEGSTHDASLVGGRTENYALHFDGFLKIEKDGVYTLSLSSDDGSVLWLDGAKLVDNDGLHGALEKTGRVSLRAGLHPIAIRFFQAGGAQSLFATIQGPGIKKQALGKFVYCEKS